jgi:N-acylneuraminate cytidylyltransferase
MSHAVALIPARGGSKRIPRKNLRPFLGKPMMAWSIDAARDSGLFERIVVSTDDAEIAELALRCGAEVPFMRPASLSDDFTGTNAVVRHGIEALRGFGIDCDPVCCIYATAPFLRCEFLAAGLRLLQASGKSFAFSVTSFEFPIQRALRMAHDGTLCAMDPQFSKVRSQDLEHAWHDAGQFYWGRADAYLQDVELYSAASVGVPIPRFLVQDIDTLEDWRRAELMLESLRRSEAESAANAPVQARPTA